LASPLHLLLLPERPHDINIMLYELITNNTHNNNIALYKCYNANKVFYRKAAFSHWGNKVIENEKRGYEWFYHDSETLIEIRLRKKYFYELDIPEFRGRKFSSESIISGNEETIEMIIDFYKGRWSTNDIFAIHGDLALCNFVIDKNNIKLVDWEHFHYSDKEYFGYDIINMLFILIYHESKRTFSLNKRNRDFLKKCYVQLIEGVDSSNKMLEKPFQNAKDYLLNFTNRFLVNTNIYKKFVLSGSQLSVLEHFDSIVTR
jgi:hypothetical protein